MGMARQRQTKENLFSKSLLLFKEENGCKNAN
jgi:hypothetical protein